MRRLMVMSCKWGWNRKRVMMDEGKKSLPVNIDERDEPTYGRTIMGVLPLDDRDTWTVRPEYNNYYKQECTVIKTPPYR